MTFRILIAAALALAASAAPAFARDRDQLGPRDAITIDPQKAYIFYRATEPAAVRFLREVTPEQRSAWLAEREAALIRARARSSTPINEATFTIPRPSATISSSRGPQFSNEAEGYTYLIAVPPGIYVLYGLVARRPSPAPSRRCRGRAGDLPVMGSVASRRAGQIVDIGEIRHPMSDDEDGGVDRARLDRQARRRRHGAPERLRGCRWSGRIARRPTRSQLFRHPDRSAPELRASRLPATSSSTSGPGSRWLGNKLQSCLSLSATSLRSGRRRRWRARLPRHRARHRSAGRVRGVLAEDGRLTLSLWPDGRCRSDAAEFIADMRLGRRNCCGWRCRADLQFDLERATAHERR